MAVGVFAAAIRLVNISFPGSLVFDEHYYVPEAKELLANGVEWNDKINAADFVAHPPLGKWCIAAGVALFGDNPFGWRAAAVLAGAVSVMILTRIATRMFGSVFFGVMAGLLMAVDGLHFVLSRTGILDIFLLTFLLAAFACLLHCRNGVAWRWLLGAGVCGGLALGVKWSAVWYLFAFAGLAFAWRGRSGFWHRSGAACALLGGAAASYLASWAGWFGTDHGWKRHWLSGKGFPEPPVLGDLVNLARHHADVLLFHVGLDAPHQYQSQPWQWMVMGRPVLFWWTDTGPCGADRCDAEILLLGTPILWWLFPFALIALFWFGVRRRDWRAWTVLVGVAAGILPWLLLPDRTKYLFYVLPSEPFLVLAVVMVVAGLAERTSGRPERRLNVLIAGGGLVAAVALCFAYFYPLFTAVTLTHEQWWARLWWIGQPWI